MPTQSYNEKNQLEFVDLENIKSKLSPQWSLENLQKVNGKDLITGILLESSVCRKYLKLTCNILNL